MPRIRSIKPEFFTSDATATLSLRARLTWIGLWTHCDDQGRCRDHPRLIHAALYPLDTDVTAVDVAADLHELAACHRILRYTVDGRNYLAITNWDEHQKPNRPQKSKHPSPEQADELPPAHEASTHAAPTPPVSEECVAGTASAKPDQSGRCTHTESSVPPHCVATGRKAHGESAAQDDNRTDNACTEDSLTGHGTRTEDSRTTQCTVTGGVVAGSRGEGAGETEREVEVREAAATRIPDDFAVTTEMLDWAHEHTPAIGKAETDKFLDYWRARGDPGAMKRDWVATWRNWMRRAQQDHDRHTPHHSPQKSTKDDRVQALDAYLVNEADSTVGDLRAIPGGAA